MKLKTARQVVGLSLLGLLLFSVAGCGGGELTTLSKEEFQKKAMDMRPDEIKKWLGKPTSVTDDDGHRATWVYHNACYDKLAGKNCDATLLVVYKPEPAGVGDQGASDSPTRHTPSPEVKSCIFSD